MREQPHAGRQERSKAEYAGKKVILLLRDPRDVMVSCYFQATKRIGVYDGPISEFVRDERFGIRRCVDFYSTWSQNLHIPRECMCVRYEDMHANPQRVLKSVLNFIGVKDVSAKLLDSAVEFGKFENMKKIEASGQFKSHALTPGDAKDNESFKVRRGKVGGYTDYLSPENCAYLTQVIAQARCSLLDPYTQGSMKQVA
jgi:hypothetical protein